MFDFQGDGDGDGTRTSEEEEEDAEKERARVECATLTRLTRRDAETSTWGIHARRRAKKSVRRVQDARTEDWGEDSELLEREIRCLDWSKPGACRAGERCALAACATDGGVEVFAPPDSPMDDCDWRKVADIGAVWADRCATNEYADVSMDVEKYAADAPAAERLADQTRRAVDFTTAAQTSLTDQTAKSGPGGASSAVKDEIKLMDTIDDDVPAVYGALARGARVEVSLGADTDSARRVGVVASASFNAIVRARIEYDDGTPGEFVVWPNEPCVAADGGLITEMFVPPESSLAVRGVRSTQLECRVRPAAPPSTSRDALRDVKPGDFIDILCGGTVWRPGRVVKMIDDGSDVIVVKTSQSGGERSVAVADCRRRNVWLGIQSGWGPYTSDGVELPIEEPRAVDVDIEMVPAENTKPTGEEDSNASATTTDAAAPQSNEEANNRKRLAVEEFISRRQLDRLYGRREHMHPGDIALCEEIFDEHGLIGTERVDARNNIRQLLRRNDDHEGAVPSSKRKKPSERHRIDAYDDALLKRADLLHFMSCAWSDRSARVLACGTKSGHVVLFSIGDDDKVDVLHAQKLSDDAWVTTLAWCEDVLFAGLSDGSVVRALASDGSLSEFQRIHPADGAAVTCMSTRASALIAGKANGDVFAYQIGDDDVASSCIRRVSFEPISGACWIRASVSSAPDQPLLAYGLSGAGYVLTTLFPIASADAPNASFYAASTTKSSSDEINTAADGKVSATRTVCASVGAAVCPAGDVVVRCDAYVSLNALQSMDGFKEAKFWRGEIIAESFDDDVRLNRNLAFRK